MSEVKGKSSLPQLISKRVHTEVPQKYQRFSSQIQKARARLNSQPNAKSFKGKEQYGTNKNTKNLHIYQKSSSSSRQNGNSLLHPRKHKTLTSQQQNSVNAYKPHELSQQSPTSSKHKCTPQPLNSIILSPIQQYYHHIMKGKQQANQQQLLELVALLRVHNPLFQKVHQVLAEALVKLGFIATYGIGDAIYKEKMPIRNIGILLWGQALLKKKKTKFRFGCYAGSALGEQLIFEQLGYSIKKNVIVDKGQFLTFERCRAIDNCGILFIGEQQYRWISEQLASQGLKDVVLSFQHVIQRIYFRKRQQRAIFG